MSDRAQHPPALTDRERRLLLLAEFQRAGERSTRLKDIAMSVAGAYQRGAATYEAWKTASDRWEREQAKVDEAFAVYQAACPPAAGPRPADAAAPAEFDVPVAPLLALARDEAETAGPYRVTVDSEGCPAAVFPSLGAARAYAQRESNRTGCILHIRIECAHRTWDGEVWPAGPADVRDLMEASGVSRRRQGEPVAVPTGHE